jgi:membrane protease YdiL (CAAX protease family)
MRPLGTRRPPLLVRVLAVLAAATLIWVAVSLALAPFGDAHTNRVGHTLRAVLTAVLVVPLVLLARRHLDRRPRAGLALAPLGRGWRPLLGGAAFWLVAAALGATMTLVLGWAAVGTGPFPASTVLLALYLPILVLLFEALPEELVFRGYLYRNLADRMPRWAAVVGQAVLFTAFGAMIGAASSVERLVLFFTFSMALGALRVVTGSLWAPIGFHLVFQWVAQYLAAAVRDGALVVEGRDVLDLMALWFFPIVLGTVVLVVVGARRGACWTARDPDPA